MNEDSGVAKGWAKAAITLVAMVAIFQTERFFPGTARKQKIIRLAIDTASFLPIPIVLKIWPEKKRISAGAWTVFFLSLVGVPILVLWLLPFVEHHPNLRDLYLRLIDWSGDWYPLLVMGPLAVIAILFEYFRSRRR